MLHTEKQFHKNITARIGGIKLVSKALKAWDPNA
jgi:hypothetical protein